MDPLYLLSVSGEGKSLTVKVSKIGTDKLQNCIFRKIQSLDYVKEVSKNWPTN